VIAVLEFLWDGWRPHSAVLGRAEGVKGYHDITRYPNARQIPGLVLFRWDAPLFFANAEFFKERILDAVTKSPGRGCGRASYEQHLVYVSEHIGGGHVYARKAIRQKYAGA
jgi:MFS superfamily sulfate permease-like transporter